MKALRPLAVFSTSVIVRRGALATTVLVLLISQSTMAQKQAQSKSTWPSFRHDFARSGIADESLDTSKLEIAWQWQATLPPEPAWDGPARWDAYNAVKDLPAMRQYDACFHPVSDGVKIYFGSSSQDTLYAIDLETGKPVWQFIANGPIRLAPSLANNKVYFGCDDGFAYCLDADKGSLIWKFSPSQYAKAERRLVINNDRLISFFPIRTGITIRDGLAYFAGSFLPWRESYLCAVDAETGKLDSTEKTFFRKHEKSTFEGSLLVTQKHVLIPQGRIAPLLFSRVDGKPLGSLPGGGGVTIVLTENEQVVRTEGGRASRPGQIGVFKGKERVASFPRGRSIVVDRDRFFVIDGEKLFAAGRTNSELKWQRNLTEPLEVIKTGSQLIIGGRDRVTAINAHSGNLTWSQKVDGRAFGLAVAGGRLIVSTDTGAIYAFAATASKAWTHPDRTAETAEATWKSPPVPAFENDDVLHRWVFHRSAMQTSDRKNVLGLDLTNVTVKDQAGKTDIQLKGNARAIRLGKSENMEATEFKKSFFPIDESHALNLPTEAITAEAWVRIDQTTTWGGIVGCIQDDGSTEHGWLLGFRENKFCFAIAGGGNGLTYLTAKDSFKTGHWYHVAGTYDGRNMKLFVDGSLVAESNAEQGPISYAEKRYFTVAAYKDANESFPLVGAIQTIRIYPRAISKTAIAKFAKAKTSFPKPAETPAPATYPRVVSWGPVGRYVRPGTIEIQYGTATPVPTVIELESKPTPIVFKNDAPKTSHRIELTNLPHRRVLNYRIRDGFDPKSKTSAPFLIDTHFDWSANEIRISKKDQPGEDLWVEAINKRAANPRGLAIVTGYEQASKAKRLAMGSELNVVLVVPDDEQATLVRNRWASEQPAVAYGKFLSVLVAQREDLPSAFANVVVSEKSDRASRRLVRPAGGIQVSSNASLIGDAEDAFWSRGDLKGSGEWSHMYGRADNSAFGGESLSEASNRQDLRTQWIGKPGPRYQTDRQNRKPAPLAAGGRLFLQGHQRIIAMDNFSGTVLWSMESPTVMRWNVPHDCANWCADKDGVYVASDQQAWFLDGRNGNITRTYEMPGESANSDTSWGYIAREKDLLIGTRVKSDAIYKDWWGKQHWFDSTGGTDTHVVTGESIFALEAASGAKAWSHEGLILHPTITILDGAIYFVESRSSAHAASTKRRISLEAKQNWVLVSLNAQSGKKNWERKLDSFDGHLSSFYLAGGGKKNARRLVLVASEATRKQFAVSTFHLQDGTPGWTRRINWETNHHGKHISRPAIQGELVYLRPEVLNLETGKTITRGFPSGHGCSSYTLCTNGMFSRLGDTTWWDVRNKKVHRFSRVRTDCWISVIPAQGMVLSAEGGGGCSCGSWLETSLGFMPRSVDQQEPQSKK